MLVVHRRHSEGRVTRIPGAMPMKLSDVLGRARHSVRAVRQMVARVRRARSDAPYLRGHRASTSKRAALPTLPSKTFVRFAAFVVKKSPAN